MFHRCVRKTFPSCRICLLGVLKFRIDGITNSLRATTLDNSNHEPFRLLWSNHFFCLEAQYTLYISKNMRIIFGHIWQSVPRLFIIKPTQKYLCFKFGWFAKKEHSNSWDVHSKIFLSFRSVVQPVWVQYLSLAMGCQDDLVEYLTPHLRKVEIFDTQRQWMRRHTKGRVDQWVLRFTPQTGFLCFVFHFISRFSFLRPIIRPIRLQALPL